MTKELQELEKSLISHLQKMLDNDTDIRVKKWEKVAVEGNKTAASFFTEDDVHMVIVTQKGNPKFELLEVG
ncbi:hypothetical protein kac65v162_gp199 [Nodularia phage vB_NspS-kac65v162]|jgi:hypothetical protein|uniref:Uncharacterized protein n=3 Tax=Ravarandavirus kac65v151 TaxID=2845689 RepID=A0A482MHI4_9CAUD|nr:hypothetical protein HWC12_gp118 [Nodularia phage vB_NspS-kac65v151]QBQ73229.1 hypothetical protein kac65v151_gp199 [Nodularia phage vB_NspS-kac65v151]QBQ73437.1 hypothetical protein kac65v161_gp199 [Nodularia phage vB_NspS-kac65v161]QBQ73643.1 hypothetical protein kac65v162_gp199 [Nodularia phage vB_NspS-kac65v162]